MANIEKFTKYFLNPEHYKKITSNKSNNKLADAYLDLLIQIWTNDYNNNFSSENIEKILYLEQIFNPKIFNNNNQNYYSGNFLLLFMETLHKELNKPNNTINQINQFYNQYDYNSTFNSFVVNFQNNHKSIISDLFYGMYNGMRQCLNCLTIIHNVQIFNILTFSLNEVQLFNNNFQNEVNILDCFTYYQSTKFNNGENQIFCNNCGFMANSSNCSKLLIGPKVLIINLILGENIKLKYEEYLYIKNYIYYENSPNYYHLTGIVTLTDNYNYIAFCKSFVDEQWYKYINEEVISSSFEEANNTGTPYYLFYSDIQVSA